MSGEDDTFDLDIYGDEENQQQQQQQQQQQEENPEDRIDFGDDSYDGNGNADDAQPDANATIKEDASSNQTAAAAAGQKRKAPDDGYDEHQNTTNAAAAAATPSNSATPSVRPTSSAATAQVDPNATLALKLSELHWWTTEEDLRSFCATAGVESELIDIAFGEHKINGKSRGEAYLEFSSREACSAVKKAVEARDEPVKQEDGKVALEGKRKNQFQVWYADQRLGNPFKGRDSGQATKKDAGAYNSAPVRGGGYQGARGGGFQPRGGFQSRGGGGFQSRGGGYQQQQNPQAFGMNGAGGGAAGFGNAYGAANPMMGGMMANPMIAMGMGFRGGFGGAGMMGGGGGMRGNFNARGGGYGGFRGGFQGGQGFQQQQQGGFQQQQQQGYGMQTGGANKRPRQE